MWEDEPGQWPQSDEPQVQDPSINDGSDLIATVKALTRRQERLADELHDFENVIEGIHHCYSSSSDKLLTITDISGRNVFKNVSNTPEWVQDSQLMISTVALTINQQPSQPSTANPYSNTNFSIDAGPSSTPASSHADILSPYAQDMGYCECSVYDCDRPHRFTQEMHPSRYLEIEYGDRYPPTGTYSCPVGCGVKPFRKPENLHTHVKCSHPEILPRPTQLPPSKVSERDVQPDRRAQLNDFLAEAYLPGMEDNPIAIADQRASGEINPLTVDDLRRRKSSGRAHLQMVYPQPSTRRSNSPMQRQLSTRTADDHAVEIQGQFGITSSDRRLRTAASNSNVSFQRPALWGQHTMEGISNFDVQHGRAPSQTQHINSPTASLSGHFTHTIQISDQSHVFQSSSDFGEELARSAIQQDHPGMSVTMHAVPLCTSTAFYRSLDTHNQSTNPLNLQTLNPYDNIGVTQQEAASFQSNYDYSNMRVPICSGQGASTSTAQKEGFSNGYAPPGFQTDTQDTHYLMNDGYAANGPIITLNDEDMLHAGQDADFTFALSTLDSDPILPQQNNLPYLDYSTLSSSGASESLVSLVDAPNAFTDKYGEDWDNASLTCGFNNMGMVRRPLL